MARTQKNKATAHHLGLLKARLAKLRRELIAPKGGGGASGEGEIKLLEYLNDHILSFNLMVVCDVHISSPRKINRRYCANVGS